MIIGGLGLDLYSPYQYDFNTGCNFTNPLYNCGTNYMNNMYSPYANTMYPYGNGYNNYQNPYLYIDSRTGQPRQTRERGVTGSLLASEGGANDGKIGFWNATWSAIKGVGRSLGSLFSGKNLGISVAVIGGLAALAAFSAPAAAVIGGVLAVGGVLLSLGGICKSIYDVYTAKSDAQAEAAWGNFGSNIFTGILSAFGVKAAKGVKVGKDASAKAAASNVTTETPASATLTNGLEASNAGTSSATGFWAICLNKINPKNWFSSAKPTPQALWSNFGDAAMQAGWIPVWAGYNSVNNRIIDNQRTINNQDLLLLTGGTPSYETIYQQAQGNPAVNGMQGFGGYPGNEFTAQNDLLNCFYNDPTMNQF